MTTNYLTNIPNACVHAGGWGIANLNDIKVVLDEVANVFIPLLNTDDMNLLPLHIKHATSGANASDGPEIFKYGTHSEIFLTCSDRYWHSYIYQFAHEILHYIINSNSSLDNKFGWFEESLCRLASLYSLWSLSDKWRSQPPYEHWTSYSTVLAEMYTRYNLETADISNDLNAWMALNIDKLSMNRYLRQENAAFASAIFPYFKANQRLWATVQYFGMANVTENTSFSNFLDEWQKQLPPSLIYTFEEFKSSIHLTC
jgi:hypothetical protein